MIKAIEAKTTKTILGIAQKPMDKSNKSSEIILFREKHVQTNFQLSQILRQPLNMV